MKRIVPDACCNDVGTRRFRYVRAPAAERARPHGRAEWTLHRWAEALFALCILRQTRPCARAPWGFEWVGVAI
eukprot:3188139-Pleurochrysis_carterae.AAC.1